jgi:cytochrome oxidase assembly protein ShyY1
VLPFLLTPRWLALHAAVVAAVIGTLVLGSWQMQAYAEQDERERVAAANLAADAPRQPLASAVPAGQALPVDAVSVPVQASGTYDPAGTLLLPGREADGVEGFYVVTPLADDDGVVTPVLRGWVATVDDPAVVPPDGAVIVEGSVQALETDADAAVDPTQPLPDGQMAALTSVGLFRTWPYSPSLVRQAQVVLAAELPADGQPAAAPAPEIVPVEQAAPAPVGVSAWRHLSYAWQWWLFAAAAIVFWGAFVRNGLREQRAAQAEAGPAEVGPAESGPAEANHQGLA